MGESGRGRERMRWEGKKEEESKATIHGNGLGAFGGDEWNLGRGPPIPDMVFLPFSISKPVSKNCGLRDYVN